jgi:pyridoxine 4-oxidase
MSIKSREWFDVLVIGSGTAGSVLAARISEDADVRVGLVEAGGAASDPRVAQPAMWPLLQGSAIDWAYRTIPQPHTANRVHEWARGKVIGGSTALNAMAHVRGHPADFESWAVKGWGYADLMPYFLRSEHYVPGASAHHAIGGPLHLIRPTAPHPVTEAYMTAGAEVGHTPTGDHNGACMTGPCLNTFTIKDGKRQTIADAYLTPAVGRPNLHLMAETQALSLILEGTRCRGVRVSDRAGTRDVMAGRVILAAGTIASPMLLMRSGIGAADELRRLGIAVRHDLPGVGRNLHDHLLSGGNVYRSRRPVPPSRYQNSESLMYIARDDAAGAPELVLACAVAPVTTERFAPLPLGEAYTIMFGFTHPRSRGTLKLASSDPDAAPLIDPNYLAEEYDRDAYLEALEQARAVGAASALSDWRLDEYLPSPSVRTTAGKRAFLEQAAFTHHHPVGTCRMGSGEDAVVGPDLAVRGLDNLYVCDASIMPAITTGPVNAAIVAIAERFSDLLRGRGTLAPYLPTAGSVVETRA